MVEGISIDSRASQSLNSVVFRSGETNRRLWCDCDSNAYLRSGALRLAVILLGWVFVMRFCRRSGRLGRRHVHNYLPVSQTTLPKRDVAQQVVAIVCDDRSTVSYDAIRIFWLLPQVYGSAGDVVSESEDEDSRS